MSSSWGRSNGALEVPQYPNLLKHFGHTSLQIAFQCVLGKVAESSASPLLPNLTIRTQRFPKLSVSHGLLLCPPLCSCLTTVILSEPYGKGRQRRLEIEVLFLPLTQAWMLLDWEVRAKNIQECSRGDIDFFHNFQRKGEEEQVKAQLYLPCERWYFFHMADQE